MLETIWFLDKKSKSTVSLKTEGEINYDYQDAFQ